MAEAAGQGGEIVAMDVREPLAPQLVAGFGDREEPLDRSLQLVNPGPEVHAVHDRGARRGDTRGLPPDRAPEIPAHAAAIRVVAVPEIDDRVLMRGKLQRQMPALRRAANRGVLIGTGIEPD